jgi:CBS domain-containing protein
MTLENASKLMCGADIGVVPVCDNGGIVGIITDRDIITRGLSKGFSPNEKVEKIMTKTVVSITPDADIKEAVKLMSDKQVRRGYGERNRRYALCWGYCAVRQTRQ